MLRESCESLHFALMRVVDPEESLLWDYPDPPIYVVGQSLIPEDASDESLLNSSPAGMASTGASFLALVIAGAKVKS